MLSSVDWAEKSLVVFIERLDFIVGNYTFRPGMKREDPQIDFWGFESLGMFLTFRTFSI